MKPSPIRTLRELVDTFPSRGDTPAIVDFGRVSAEGAPTTTTYRALHETIERIAQGLADRGLGAGDMVLLCAPNGLGWVSSCFGIVCAGAVAVPLDDQAGKDVLIAVLRHSGAKFAFTSERHAGQLRDHADLLPDHALLDRDDGDPRGWRRVLVPKRDDVPIDPSQVASLLYTSGTTGTPKAVPLTHGNFAANVSALLTADLIRSTDRVLMPLPLHHTYPFTVGLLTALGTGATIVMPSGVTGPEITGAAKASAATALLGVPSLYEAVWQGINARVAAGGERQAKLFRRLLRASGGIRRVTKLRIGKLVFGQLHRAVGPRLEILGCGGAKLDPALAESLEALGWTVLTGYGLTETSPVLTFNSRRRRRLSSEGRALPGVELQIVKTPETEHGEILARGPNVFSGYRENPDATRAAFTDDGWFRTGDLGWLDESEYLHVVGRLKEVIVLADGKNVFPEDVEPAYAQSPLLKEVAILERNGALVGLVVPDEDEVRKRGGLGALRLLKDELEAIAMGLPPYQRIVDFRAVRESLPRTRLGKIRRHQLPQLYERAGKRSLEEQPVEIGAEDRALIESSETTSKVWAWLEERYPDRKLHLDMSPQLDLQIDSLGWVSMTLELEHRFGVSLPSAAVSRILSLRDLLTEVRQAESRPRPAEPGKRFVPPPPPGPLLRAAGVALYALNRFMVRTFFRLHVTGADRLPAGACLVVTPNHLSYLDPLAIAAALPSDVLRKMHWAGWVGKMYSGPVMRFISRATRVFPVDPDQDLAGALDTGRALVTSRKSLVWFPEGRRSPTGTLQPFRPGIGVLLKDQPCSVVPAWVAGTREAWPIGQRLPRTGHPVTVVFGEPVAVDTLAQEGEGDTPEARIRTALERRVASLSGRPPTPHSGQDDGRSAGGGSDGTMAGSGIARETALTRGSGDGHR